MGARETERMVEICREDGALGTWRIWLFKSLDFAHLHGRH